MVTQVANSLPADTKVEIQVGSFHYVGQLLDDPHYSPGNLSADLPVVGDNSTKTRKIVKGMVHLLWVKNHIGFTFRGGEASIVADDYLMQNPGAVKGATKAHLDFGGIAVDIPIAYHGRIAKALEKSGASHGERVTVEIKGDGRSK